MDRAQAIRDDCRVLMVGEDSPSKAGYDLLQPTLPHDLSHPITTDSTSWP